MSKETKEKQQEDQVELLIGTGLLLGALGIAYAVGQTIGSNIQPIKQGIIDFLNYIPINFARNEFYRIIGLIISSLFLIGLIKYMQIEPKEEDDFSVLGCLLGLLFTIYILIISLLG